MQDPDRVFVILGLQWAPIVFRGTFWPSVPLVHRLLIWPSRRLLQSFP
jgi:hypothetical protein